MTHCRRLAAAAGLTVLGVAAAHHAPTHRPTVHAAPVRHVKHATATAREARFLAAARPGPSPASRSEVRAPVPTPTHTTTPTLPPTAAPSASFLTWLHSAESKAVRECESSMNYRMVENNNGTWYFGAWSANEDFVRTYADVDPWQWVRDGAFLLPKAAQDRMAYRGWQARGWSPWACAS